MNENENDTCENVADELRPASESGVSNVVSGVTDADVGTDCEGGDSSDVTAQDACPDVPRDAEVVLDVDSDEDENRYFDDIDPADLPDMDLASFGPVVTDVRYEWLSETGDLPSSLILFLNGVVEELNQTRGGFPLLAHIRLLRRKHFLARKYLAGQDMRRARQVFGKPLSNRLGICDVIVDMYARTILEGDPEGKSAPRIDEIRAAIDVIQANMPPKGSDEEMLFGLQKVIGNLDSVYRENLWDAMGGSSPAWELSLECMRDEMEQRGIAPDMIDDALQYFFDPYGGEPRAHMSMYDEDSETDSHFDGIEIDSMTPEDIKKWLILDSDPLPEGMPVNDFLSWDEEGALPPCLDEDWSPTKCEEVCAEWSAVNVGLVYELSVARNRWRESLEPVKTDTYAAIAAHWDHISDEFLGPVITKHQGSVSVTDMPALHDALCAVTLDADFADYCVQRLLFFEGDTAMDEVLDKQASEQKKGRQIVVEAADPDRVVWIDQTNRASKRSEVLDGSEPVAEPDWSHESDFVLPVLTLEEATSDDLMGMWVSHAFLDAMEALVQANLTPGASRHILDAIASIRHSKRGAPVIEEAKTEGPFPIENGNDVDSLLSTGDRYNVTEITSEMAEQINKQCHQFVRDVVPGMSIREIQSHAHRWRNRLEAAIGAWVNPLVSDVVKARITSIMANVDDKDFVQNCVTYASLLRTFDSRAGESPRVDTSQAIRDKFPVDLGDLTDAAAEIVASGDAGIEWVEKIASPDLRAHALGITALSELWQGAPDISDVFPGLTERRSDNSTLKARAELDAFINKQKNQNPPPVTAVDSWSAVKTAFRVSFQATEADLALWDRLLAVALPVASVPFDPSKDTIADYFKRLVVAEPNESRVREWMDLAVQFAKRA